MFPKIKSVKDRNDFKLDVIFDDGKHVLYDVYEDIKQIPDFKPLETLTGLWKDYSLDKSRTCIYWNDRIDLSSGSIYQYGVEI